MILLQIFNISKIFEQPSDQTYFQIRSPCQQHKAALRSQKTFKIQAFKQIAWTVVTGHLNADAAEGIMKFSHRNLDYQVILAASKTQWD